MDRGVCKQSTVINCPDSKSMAVVVVVLVSEYLLFYFNKIPVGATPSFFTQKNNDYLFFSRDLINPLII